MYGPCTEITEEEGLGEGVKEPVLRGKGEGKGRQGGRKMAYGPYQGGPHHKSGEEGRAASPSVSGI